MIKPAEIQQKARATGVRDQQIEKDYILSWILKGIAQHAILSKVIVFKGGTVLKKIYFEDYRFSEDLDFTLINNEISNEQIFVCTNFYVIPWKRFWWKKCGQSCSACKHVIFMISGISWNNMEWTLISI